MRAALAFSLPALSLLALSLLALSLLALILSFALIPAAARAQGGFETGRSLLGHCTSENIAAKSHCLGYIVGVYDALDTSRFFYTPEDISAGRLRDVVLAYLQQNPERWDFQAENVVAIALGKVYPCE
jgi:hypothetical protein